MMDSQRSLAAIVFTDAVGFAGRANVDEADALEEIERDFAVMRESCTRHDGQVLKSLGDGLLMVFSSAVQAVLCSIDIQDRLQKAEGQDPLLHRIGIHLGDIILSETDAKGDGVNIAARLEQEAPPGGICMSGTIYDVVKSRLTVQVRSRGITQLKNIAEPIQVYEIGPSAETIEKVTLRRRGEPERQSMATSYAIFFLGVCILGAAGIYFMANRKKEPETIPFPFGNFRNLSDDDGSSRIIKMTPEGKTEFRGDPTSKEFRAELEKMREDLMRTIPEVSKIEEQIRKEGQLKVKTGAEDITLRPLIDRDVPKPPSTGGTVEPPDVPATGTSAEDTFKSYEAARNAYATGYRFDDMVKWIKQQSWASRPVGVAALQHWEKLVQMKAMMMDAMIASIKEGEDGKAIDPEQFETTIKALSPKHFRAMAVGLAMKAGKSQQLKPLLVAFDLEYSKDGLSKLFRNKAESPSS